jgi:hypothetical protein
LASECTPGRLEVPKLDSSNAIEARMVQDIVHTPLSFAACWARASHVAGIWELARAEGSWESDPGPVEASDTSAARLNRPVRGRRITPVAAMRVRNSFVWFTAPEGRRCGR